MGPNVACQFISDACSNMCPPVRLRQTCVLQNICQFVKNPNNRIINIFVCEADLEILMLFVSQLVS